MRRYLTLLAFMVLPFAAVAGGGSWSVRVLELKKHSASVASITIAPLELGGPWHGCEKATIELAWDPEPFGLRTWSPKRVNRETYRAALAMLSNAAGAPTPERFGQMGTGLVTSAKPCTFRSRGLAILEEHGGGNGVYSFHEPI
jgi:hypothetical protein